MPWITITAADSGGGTRSALPARVAAEAAAALGLSSGDIIVLDHATAAVWGQGAVVTVYGRRRDADREAELLERLRHVVAAGLGIADEVVHVARTTA